MFTTDIVSFLIVLIFAGVLAYRISFLKNRKIWRLSLFQILLLIILPGFLFITLFSYMETLMLRPKISNPLLSDRLLINLTLLSMLFGYGGIAIHAVTKMLSETSLRYDNSEVGKLNRYFHLNFSHNLIYSGAIFLVVGLTLLELNHVPVSGYGGWWAPIWRGILVGFLYVSSMYNYTRSHDDYVGRWADLKAVFLVIWMGLVLLFYGVWKISPSLKEYQLLVPVLSALSLMLVLNTGLFFRWLKNKKK